jgi:ankyrin repeat protein
MSAAPPALVEAVKAGDSATIRAQLAADPGLAGARDENGLSLILLALFHRQPADALLEAGPPLGVLEAAALGRADALERLLDENPQRLHDRTPEGFDPLGLAAFLGGAGAVRVLLERGADPDGDPENPMRARPAHAAAAEHDHESMRLLLEAGADPDARQQGGFTPLHAAAHSDDVEMARLLLAHGADPALTLDDGRDAARLAADDGSPNVAALLDR